MTIKPSDVKANEAKKQNSTKGSGKDSKNHKKKPLLNLTSHSLSEDGKTLHIKKKHDEGDDHDDEDDMEGMDVDTELERLVFAIGAEDDAAAIAELHAQHDAITAARNEALAALKRAREDEEDSENAAQKPKTASEPGSSGTSSSTTGNDEFKTDVVPADDAADVPGIDAQLLVDIVQSKASIDMRMLKTLVIGDVKNVKKHFPKEWRFLKHEKATNYHKGKANCKGSLTLKGIDTIVVVFPGKNFYDKLLAESPTLFEEMNRLTIFVVHEVPFLELPVATFIDWIHHPVVTRQGIKAAWTPWTHAVFALEDAIPCVIKTPDRSFAVDKGGLCFSFGAPEANRLSQHTTGEVVTIVPQFEKDEDSDQRMWFDVAQNSADQTALLKLLKRMTVDHNAVQSKKKSYGGNKEHKRTLYQLIFEDDDAIAGEIANWLTEHPTILYSSIAIFSDTTVRRLECPLHTAALLVEELGGVPCISIGPTQQLVAFPPNWDDLEITILAKQVSQRVGGSFNSINEIVSRNGHTLHIKTFSVIPAFAKGLGLSPCDADLVEGRIQGFPDEYDHAKALVHLNKAAASISIKKITASQLHRSKGRDNNAGAYFLKLPRADALKVMSTFRNGYTMKNSKSKNSIRFTFAVTVDDAPTTGPIVHPLTEEQVQAFVAKKSAMMTKHGKKEGDGDESTATGDHSTTDARSEEVASSKDDSET